MIFSIEEFSNLIQKQFIFKILSISKKICVKIVERRILIYGKIDSIQLFSKNDIEKNKKEFSFLDIRAVQVVLVSMFGSGLDTSVLVILHDKRHKDLSLLRINKSAYVTFLLKNPYTHPYTQDI